MAGSRPSERGRAPPGALPGRVLGDAGAVSPAAAAPRRAYDGSARGGWFASVGDRAPDRARKRPARLTLHSPDELGKRPRPAGAERGFPRARAWAARAVEKISGRHSPKG